jgi:predicted permease
VSSGYFETMGIPVKAGREFTDGDRAGSQPVIIVNDDFARRYFPNENPIGQQIFPWAPQPATVVGVVSSVRQVSLEREALSEIYVPAAQAPWQLGDVTYVLSTTADPDQYVGAVRAAVRDIGPDQPIYLVTPMEQVISASLRGRRLTLSLLGIFAGLAVLLSAAGVYGVISYGVSQRRREIGIRMALGARGSDVTGMVLKGAARRAAIGTAVGVGAALGLTRVLDTMLYQVGARDPVTFVTVAFMIVIIALAASVTPALRAARVQPMSAMRVD